ncbi:LIM domain protein [Necator americanus]|uniref:Cysteine-rich protein 1 n=1 Tax=Necator americanus TaxID=51031 RepID=W2SG48_NECAM|nr:LIM domain protein [Necator americanus]ETN68599.1 LIM domain protein [Necator americanus]
MIELFTAERVTSIGKDWHRPCLRCENEACKKTLAAGGHSERDGKPYCNRCYGALFGPRGYGHGGVESHTFHHGQTGKSVTNETIYTSITQVVFVTLNATS